MLRASTEATDTQVDLLAIDDADRDPLVEGGAALLAFVTVVVGREAMLLPGGIAAVAQALGSDAVSAAAGAAGNFEMMNRLLDATGVPHPKDLSILVDLGLTLDWPR